MCVSFNKCAYCACSFHISMQDQECDITIFIHMTVTYILICVSTHHILYAASRTLLLHTMHGHKYTKKAHWQCISSVLINVITCYICFLSSSSLSCSSILFHAWHTSFTHTFVFVSVWGPLLTKYFLQLLPISSIHTTNAPNPPTQPSNFWSFVWK